MNPVDDNIDYTYSDLPESTLLKRIRDKAKEREVEKQKEKERWAKARNFHFKGGML